jgi:hypothetical protein
LDFGLWILVFGLWSLVFGLWSLGCISNSRYDPKNIRDRLLRRRFTVKDIPITGGGTSISKPISTGIGPSFPCAFFAASTMGCRTPRTKPFSKGLSAINAAGAGLNL